MALLLLPVNPGLFIAFNDDAMAEAATSSGSMN